MISFGDIVINGANSDPNVIAEAVMEKITQMTFDGNKIIHKNGIITEAV